MRLSPGPDQNTDRRKYDRTARRRLQKLGGISPVWRIMLRPMKTVGFAILVAALIVVAAAIAVGTPAANFIESYAARLRELMF